MNINKNINKKKVIVAALVLIAHSNTQGAQGEKFNPLINVLGNVPAVCDQLKATTADFGSLVDKLKAFDNLFQNLGEKRDAAYSCIAQSIASLIAKNQACSAYKQQYQTESEATLALVCLQIKKVQDSTTQEINALDQEIRALDADILHHEQLLVAANGADAETTQLILDQINCIKAAYADQLEKKQNLKTVLVALEGKISVFNGQNLSKAEEAQKSCTGVEFKQ
ncbi:MAG: hypothetical protein NT124_00860 [Candidatus Dependentiae bacterium]|nr:hypothetical protein [Candidatus Dependentiae bacterium]